MPDMSKYVGKNARVLINHSISLPVTSWSVGLVETAPPAPRRRTKGQDWRAFYHALHDAELRHAWVHGYSFQARWTRGRITDPAAYSQLLDRLADHVKQNP